MLNYPKAITFLQKAFVIQQEIGEQNAAVTVTNIGAIYFEQGKNKEAFHYYNKANELFKKTDNKRGLALLYNYYGDYYVKMNNNEVAKTFYEKALVLNDEMQNKFGASLALYNIGQLLTNEKKYSQAMVFAQKSLDYATEIGVLYQTFHSEKLVSELHAFLGNSELSLAHYKKYILARDSINNHENTKKFAIAEMNFEYQKKEAILAEKHKSQTQFVVFSIVGTLLLIGLVFVIYNRRQLKKRLTLQKEVAEYEQKALHLQMNPHFVFNCLSSISSFIVQNGTDSALKYLSKFSKLMRLTLEYSKEALIPIDKEIESLQNYLELEQLRFHNAFDFSIHSTENVEFNVGLPPLLIQPFVENAIKHV
jgi:tetratricopeptide (TPR) repeat protein